MARHLSAPEREIIRQCAQQHIPADVIQQRLADAGFNKSVQTIRRAAEYRAANNMPALKPYHRIKAAAPEPVTKAFVEFDGLRIRKATRLVPAIDSFGQVSGFHRISLPAISILQPEQKGA